MPNQSDTSLNTLLGALSSSELDPLRPHLEAVDLEIRRKLAIPHQDIDYVYFMQSGIASIVGSVRNDIPVELGVIGREGLANLPALLGTDRTPNECMIQVAGQALRLPVANARLAMEQSTVFNRIVRQAAYLVMVQTSSTVLANARATISQRLARWLLMARDRLDGDTMALTHEFISYMLGVRRPGVTLTLSSFEEAGWISRGRGHVTLLNRSALVEEASGFYGSSEGETRRLFDATALGH